MGMKVPSGREFNDYDLGLAVRMHETGFVRRSDTPLTLESGVESCVYVQGRGDFTEQPALMRRIGHQICDLIEAQTTPHDRRPCLIGIPVAGASLAYATVMSSVSSKHKREFHLHAMRQVKKTHGADHGWIDGKPDLSRHTYWLVDNVTTSGKSKLTAASRMAENGYPKRPPCFIWIDRQQGAIERLRREGFERIVVAYYLLDLVFAFGEMGLWPTETVQIIEREIANNQL